MKKDEKFQKEKIGEPKYINENCWLVKTLNYLPGERCRYCELKFRSCLFFQYLIISLILIFFLLALSFLINGEISKLVAISIFLLVIIYGYFFNKSTEKIIKANFAQRKAKEALEELTENLEKKVEEQTKSLKELLSMKSEFLNTVSHQLRTPTTIFRSMLSMITENNLTKEQKEEWINDCYGAANRLLIIIEGILEANTFEGRTPSFDFKLCDSEKVLQDAINIFTNIAQKKGVILEYQKPVSPTGRPKEELPQIMADAGWLRSVFIKLIDNAIWYTRKGGRVDVSVCFNKQANTISIKVQDTGIGLTQEDKKILFKKFSRGRGSWGMNVNSSGLGLYIAKRIAEGHHGEITAESEGEDKGSVFTITLPVIQEM